MASTTVKKPSAKKSPEGRPITRCGWCDRHGEMNSAVRNFTTSYGRQTKENANEQYYCNCDCLLAHMRQEQAIDLHNLNDFLKEKTITITQQYKNLLKDLKDEPDNDMLKKNSAGYYAQLKYTKARIDFNHSLLARETKDVLTMKRYKCLKIAGDLYEAYQECDDVGSEQHDHALNQIYYFNDNFDENGKQKITGAVGHIIAFGK